MSVPNIVKPLYAHPDKYGGAIKDEFGIIYTTSKIDRGSPVGHCLSKADLTTINSRTQQENTVLKGWHSGVKITRNIILFYG